MMNPSKGDDVVGGFEIDEVMDFLPHRYPFLMVDRVLEVEGGKYIKAMKNVTINEPHFLGHFPGFPIMPGVLIVEGMAQTAGLMLKEMVREFNVNLYCGERQNERYQKNRNDRFFW